MNEFNPNKNKSVAVKSKTSEIEMVPEYLPDLYNSASKALCV